MPATLPAHKPEQADMTTETFLDADAPHEAQDAGNEAGKEAFTPDMTDKADWVLGKIADARHRAARVRENAEAIAHQHEAEAARLLFLFGAALQEWARQETDGTRRRSVRLLNGQIGFRTKPAAFTIADEGEARAWAEANLPAALRMDKRAFADVLSITDDGNAVHRETGERLAFVTVAPSEEVFFVQ